MKVYNNFLPKEEFLEIKNFMTGNYFPWYVQNSVVNEKDNNFQLTHLFYNNCIVNSDFFKILNVFLNKINPLCIIRIKANLLTKTEKIIEHEMHTDFQSDSTKKITTGIFYINTNNGYTKFKNKKIESIENRYVSFNSNELHTGTTCTDENYRIVINFNYIK
jgi:hypothetical protein